MFRLFKRKNKKHTAYTKSIVISSLDGSEYINHLEFPPQGNESLIDSHNAFYWHKFAIENKFLKIARKYGPCEMHQDGYEEYGHQRKAKSQNRYMDPALKYFTWWVSKNGW